MAWRRPPTTDEPPPDPFDLGLRLLAQRPHGEAELGRKLTRRGCDPAAVGGALARLRELGYLDDAAFARALVARRASARGTSLIGAELAAKGIGPAAARAALDTVTEEDERAAARRLAERWGGLPAQRVAARLRRRGFSDEAVRAALDGSEAHDRRQTGRRGAG
jgi:regulatory protein